MIKLLQNPDFYNFLIAFTAGFYALLYYPLIRKSLKSIYEKVPPEQIVKFTKAKRAKILDSLINLLLISGFIIGTVGSLLTIGR
jgi:hypothetical protein